MAREQRIVATFVEFADTLVADFDVVEFLHRVAERCVELLDCVESGVLIADPAGTLRAMASSSERTEALELLQAQNDEGPCFESYHDGGRCSARISQRMPAAGQCLRRRRCEPGSARSTRFRCERTARRSAR